jgi:hypothetical protein
MSPNSPEPTNDSSATTSETRQGNQRRKTSAVAGEQIFEARKEEDEAHRRMEQEAKRLYAEKMEEEYAKREGGA